MGVLKRVTAWFKRLDESDWKLIETHLDPPGQFLFSQMSKIDQLHALEVGRSILSETAAEKGLKMKILIQAALLHDVGKVRGDYNMFSRMLVGLVKRIRPTLRGKLTFTNPHNFWQKVGYGFYVDLVHPARGAHMARLFGVEPTVVELIRRHHDPPSQEHSPELRWLQIADSRN